MPCEPRSSNSIKHGVFSGKIELVKTRQIVLSERRWVMACHRDRCVAHLCPPMGMASHHSGQTCESQEIRKNSQLPRGMAEKQILLKWPYSACGLSDYSRDFIKQKNSAPCWHIWLYYSATSWKLIWYWPLPLFSSLLEFMQVIYEHTRY